MAVVVSNDFIHLEVPAFDGFILTAAEQIRMLLGELEASNAIDMSCEGDLQLS